MDGEWVVGEQRNDLENSMVGRADAGHELRVSRVATRISDERRNREIKLHPDGRRDEDQQGASVPIYSSAISTSPFPRVATAGNSFDSNHQSDFVRNGYGSLNVPMSLSFMSM